jgi:hypothetical protein
MTAMINDHEAREEDRAAFFDEVATQVSDLNEALDELLTPIEESDGLDSASLQELVGLLAKIFDSEPARLSFVYAPENLRPKLWLNHAFIQSVSTELSILRDRLVGLADVGSVNYLVQGLTQDLVGAMRRAKLHDYSYLTQEIQEQLAGLIRGLSDRVDLFEQLLGLNELKDRAKEAADAAQSSASTATVAADATKAAAGITGNVQPSFFYSKMAAKEAAVANRFRLLTAGFSYAAVAAAGIFVLLPSGILPALDVAPNDYVRLIQKAVFVAAVFGLTGYFARQVNGKLGRVPRCPAPDL